MAQKKASKQLVLKRTQQQLSIAEVAERLQVAESIIVSLEKGESGGLNPREAGRLLRSYAMILGLNPANFASQNREKQKYKRRKIFVVSKFGITVLSISLLMAAFGFIAWRTWVSNTPLLEIDRPQSGLVTTQSTLAITGRTNESSQVYINNQTIPSSSEGGFESQYFLSPGSNEIEIKAINRLGRESIQVLTIVLLDEND